MRGLGVHDHVCWCFDTRAEFRARAAEFLADGLRAGQRVLYIAGGEPGALAAELRQVRGWDDALTSGAAGVASVEGTYTARAVVDPAQQVVTYAQLTEQALAEGFRGLRLAADATSLVRTADQVEAFARYEHLVDSYMASAPLSALCAYDRTELGQARIEQIACMHPIANSGAAAFRVHAGGRPGCAAAVSGNVDAASAKLWTHALRWARPRPDSDDRLVLDAAELEFISHRGLLELAEYARQRGGSVVLHDGPSSAARLTEVLGLSDVRVDPVRRRPRDGLRRAPDSERTR